MSWTRRKLQSQNRRVGDLMLAFEQLKQSLQGYNTKLDEMSVSL